MLHKPEKFPFPVLTASRTLLETTGSFITGTLKAAGLGNVLPPRLILLFNQVQSAFQCPRDEEEMETEVERETLTDTRDETEGGQEDPEVMEKGEMGKTDDVEIK